MWCVLLEVRTDFYNTILLASPHERLNCCLFLSLNTVTRRRRKYQDDGENYTPRSYLICTIHQILKE
jgi:hypothetical protein